MTETTRTTDIVIAGGGSADMMAGLSFARAGPKTIVLERHGDFLRDFRGDTVHPATLDLLDELGMLDRFLALPHDRSADRRVLVPRVQGENAGERHARLSPADGWWRPGLIAIGDAAHAMSPVGGSASTWRCRMRWSRLISWRRR